MKLKNEENSSPNPLVEFCKVNQKSKQTIELSEVPSYFQKKIIYTQPTPRLLEWESHMLLRCVVGGAAPR